MVIDNASHAGIAEQPEAISRALIDFADALWRR
jgi:pimeloyl-ACP methyl ester carboxylesterase